MLRTKLGFRQKSNYINIRLANNKRVLKNYIESPLTYEYNLLLAIHSSKVTSLFSSFVSIGGKALEQFTWLQQQRQQTTNVFPATEQHAKGNQTGTRSAAGNRFFTYTDIGLSDIQALDGYLLKTMKWKLEKKYMSFNLNAMGNTTQEIQLVLLFFMRWSTLKRSLV